MKLVCITGIDGAGKSTLAKGIVTALMSEGKPARYVYGRIKPALSLILMKLGRSLVLKKNNPWTDFTGYSNDKKKTMRNPVLRFFYSLSVYMDFYIQIWWKLFPFSISSMNVILDRYIYDTVISDLAVHLGYSEEYAEASIRKAGKFIPKPQITLFIDLPEEAAFARKTDVPHIDYLRERRCYFQTLQKKLGWDCLDGEKSQAELIESSLILLRKNAGNS